MEIRRLSLKVSGDEKTPLVKVETAARFRSSKFQSSLLPCSRQSSSGHRLLEGYGGSYMVKCSVSSNTLSKELLEGCGIYSRRLYGK